MNQAVAGGGARRLHSRLLTVAEMQARDLMRRHVAMGLLLVLPLAFYGSLAGTRGRHAMGAGGVGMAFSIAGAAVFSLLASRRADPQLILAGYRPFELMLGRPLFLDAASAVVVGGFAWLMAVASGPQHPWAMALGTALTAVVAVPLGLALGAVVPGELEGTLALIGIVGIQLSLPDNAAFGVVLPFWGARKLLEEVSTFGGSLVKPLMASLAYGAGLLALAIVLWTRRMRLRRAAPRLLLPPSRLQAPDTSP